MIRTFLALLASVLLLQTGVLQAQEMMDQLTGEEVILNAESLQTVEEKVSYLLLKGKEFMASEHLEDAKVVAQYILDNLDENSEPAKQLLTDVGSMMEKLQDIKDEGKGMIKNLLPR